MFFRYFAVAALTALAALAGSAPVWSQDRFPSKPIHVVVPFPPGGGVDVLARMMGERMGSQLGVSVVVENRAGASGTIGGQYVRQSAPDGYTVLFSSNTHTMSKLVMAAAPYDPIGDFTPIARVGEAPLLVVIANRLPQTSLGEIAAAAKADPKSWTAGTPALGSPSHLATLALNRLTSANITIAPYKGTAPALNDVAGGHIEMLIDAMVVLLPQAKAGRVKGVAVTSAKRASIAPEIPTTAEAGLPGLNVVAWYGLWGPSGMPASVVSSLNNAANAALKDIAASGGLAKLGVEPTGGTPEDFAKHQAAEVQRNAELLSYAKFEPQ